jgi:hypothetical protein
MRNFIGDVGLWKEMAIYASPSYTNGCFYYEDRSNHTPVAISGTMVPGKHIRFDPSLVTPTAYENRPASISEARYISY